MMKNKCVPFLLPDIPENWEFFYLPEQDIADGGEGRRVDDFVADRVIQDAIIFGLKNAGRQEIRK